MNEKKNYSITPHKSNGGELPKGVQCGVHLASANSTLKHSKEHWDLLNKNGLPIDNEKNRLTHVRLEYISPQSLCQLFAFISFGGQFFFFSAIVYAFILLLSNGVSGLKDLDIISMMIIPALVYFVFKKLAFSDKFENKIWAHVNRQEGTITIFPGHKTIRSLKDLNFGPFKDPDHKPFTEPQTRPFSEFDGYINSSIRTNSGMKDFDLWVSHKSERLWFMLGIFHTSKDMVLLQWEFIQAYMDKTQPLPDIPALEPYRKHDPVTAAWDKKNKRPENLFQNMPNDTYKKLNSLAWKYAGNYPWGYTREEAIKKGWKPPPEKFWTLVPEDSLTE